MKHQKSNITDVAKRAGVSTATVSHVINGTRFVSEEVSRKVKDVIKEMGYVPSSIARGLASKRSKLIGVVFSDITNPFFHEVYQSLETVLARHDYDIILANTGEIDDNQEKVLRSLFSQQIDGLIIAPTGRDSEWLGKIISSEIPVVFIDRKGPFDSVTIVNLDNADAAYKATTHLINDGHTRIGIILGLPDVSTTVERLKGYQKALTDNGLLFLPEYVVNGLSRIEGGYASTKQLLALKDPPTAIFPTNNFMTNGMLHAIREQGLNIPKDLGVIGFDDHHWADIFSPPLTVIRQPIKELGIEVAKNLILKINNQPTKSNQLKSELIIRGSCSEKCLQQNTSLLVTISQIHNKEVK